MARQAQVAGENKDLPAGVTGLENVAYLFIERSHFGFFAEPGAVRWIDDQEPRLRGRERHLSEGAHVEADKLFDPGAAGVFARGLDCSRVAIGGDEFAGWSRQLFFLR